jgi:hypothetical protein
MINLERNPSARAISSRQVDKHAGGDGFSLDLGRAREATKLAQAHVDDGRPIVNHPAEDQWVDEDGTIELTVTAPAYDGEEAAPAERKSSLFGLVNPGVFAVAGVLAAADGPLVFGDVAAGALLMGAGLASAVAAFNSGRFASISHEDFEEGAGGIRTDLFPDPGVEEIEAGPTPPVRDDDLGDPNAGVKKSGPEIELEQSTAPRPRIDFEMPFMASLPDPERDLPIPRPNTGPGGDLSSSINASEFFSATELGPQSKERMQLYRKQRERLPEVINEVRAAASSARPVATLKANQNVAKVEWNIEGNSGQLLSASGSKQISGFVPSVDSEKALIPAMFNNRSSDTEYKLLNAVAQELNEKYQGRDTTGSITLFSEFSVCISCANVIKEFKKMFPLVDITVIAGPRQRRPASLSDKLPKSGPDQ